MEEFEHPNLSPEVVNMNLSRDVSNNSEVKYSSPKVIPQSDDEDDNVKIESSSEKEFSFSYTHSEGDPDQQSEYVGFEARKQGVYQNTSEDESHESQKEVAQENPYLHLSPINDR